RFAPGIEQVHALISFADLSRFARVHGETICATVDLRNADLDKFAQLRIKPRLIDIGLQNSHSLIGGRADFRYVNSLLHEELAMDDVARCETLRAKIAVSLTAS